MNNTLRKIIAVILLAVGIPNAVWMVWHGTMFVWANQGIGSSGEDSAGRVMIALVLGLLGTMFGTMLANNATKRS